MPPAEDLCESCKNCAIYTVVGGEHDAEGQRRRVCIVTAERLAPQERVTECTFYAEVGSGPRHYVDS